MTWSAYLCAGSLVRGNSIRLLFESVIFIFVVHPFDVVGRCRFTPG
jgi:hypothetical protein